MLLSPSLLSSLSNPKMALFLVVCGTYERNLYGFEVHPVRKDDSEPAKASKKKAGKDETGTKEEPQVELKPVFIYPSHGGCIKCLHLSGKYLASGSTDEIIKYVGFFVSHELFLN